jgi:large subunit ribosomal protein L21
MYAVIETGGKQYRVEVGTELEVELLDAEPGKTITLDRVLLVADGDDSTIGQPVVADASVSVEVVSQKRGPKLISFKYRPKARRRVKKGHRQELTLLRVADITLGGKSAAKERKQADDAVAAERKRAEDAAAAQAAKDAELAEKLAVGTATTPTKASRAKAETTAEKPAKAETAEKPAKAETTEKAGTTDKAGTTEKPAKAEAAQKPAKAEKADATEKPAKASKAEAAEKPATRSTAKAEGDADASEDATAKPKRSRTTKKDE